jgi:hypothetical protein
MKNKSKVPLVRLFGIIALVAVIGFSMVGCKTDEDDSNGDGGNVSIPETNVQVYNRDGTPYTGSGKVRFFLVNQQDKVIEVGTVTDGKLTLSLPSDADMLASIGSTGTNLAMDGLKLYPTGSTSGKYFDYIGQKENKVYSVTYVYSKTDYNVNYSAPGGYNYQIDVKAGWVKLLDITESGQPLLLTNKLSGLPSDMKWTVGN